MTLTLRLRPVQSVVAITFEFSRVNIMSIAVCLALLGGKGGTGAQCEHHHHHYQHQQLGAHLFEVMLEQVKRVVHVHKSLLETVRLWLAVHCYLSAAATVCGRQTRCDHQK